MTGIAVPRLNSNDISYTLVEWLAPDGGQISEGDPVAVIETSKAGCEVTAQRSGILHHDLQVGSDCKVGDLIGRIFDSAEQREHAVAGQRAPTVRRLHEDGEVLITQAAAALASEHGLANDDLIRLGQPVVRQSDVARLLGLATAAEHEVYIPARAQRAVADAVSRSHATIPAACTIVKVYGAAIAVARRLAGSAGTGPAGLTEIVLKAVAALHEHHRVFFATRADDGEVRLHPAAHVGVTVDVGTGLYVPVISDTASRTIRELEELLAGFRRAARRGTFSEGELQGGNFVLAMHDYAGIEFAIPVIFPGQVCALAVGGLQNELYLQASGAVGKRSCLRLCLTYDHRLVNGRDAALFTRELKLILESQDRLQQLVR